MKLLTLKFGKRYQTINKQNCICTAVSNDFVNFTYNNSYSIRYPKMLFAGVYAAMKYGSPYILSNLIKPIIDVSIEHNLLGKRKLHNVYFKMNSIDETYINIFTKHMNKISFS